MLNFIIFFDFLVSSDATEASGNSPVKSNSTLSDAHSSQDGSFNEPSTSDNLDLK